ncbi:HIT family protein [Actinoplanes sp. NPDC049668]|uniref:HIT family protein n=1 Tax=unclassified Actinoplanes TaxID=2626549 RepID=UPI0033B7B824
MRDPDCPFCGIAAGRSEARIVFESPEAMAFLPLNPASRGHTLVIPRDHHADFLTMPSGLNGPVYTAASIVGHALDRALSPEGMNLISSAGEAATQTVLHAHIHLVPRWRGDEIGGIWPTARTTGDELQDDIAGLIRAEILKGRQSVHF